MRLTTLRHGESYPLLESDDCCACQCGRSSKCSRERAPNSRRHESQFHQQPIEPACRRKNPAARVTANAGKGNLDMRELTVRDDNCSDRAPARTRNITCAVCQRAIVHMSGRRPQVCSTRCRNRKNDRGRVRKAFLGGDTGAPAKRRKNNNESNALERAKTLSSRGISGPCARSRGRSVRPHLDAHD